MKKLVILLAAALTFNSCSDSFLDLSNPSALSPSVYPKSMADMETIVTSVYANMVAVPLYGKRVMAKGTFCVDHTVDMAWTGDANWNQLATNQVTSDNAYIGTLWIGYYKMISCANTVLEQLERIDKEKFTDADLARLSQMKGEALFWRGWAHQQLVAFFGEGYPCNGDGDKKGVPVRLQVASTPDMLNIERSTVAEVYDQILKDYEAAKLLLPAVQPVFPCNFFSAILKSICGRPSSKTFSPFTSTTFHLPSNFFTSVLTSEQENIIPTKAGSKNA